MQTLCHCSQHATVSAHGLMICTQCEDFLARYPALRPTLIEQWRKSSVESPAEPDPEEQA